MIAETYRRYQLGKGAASPYASKYQPGYAHEVAEGGRHG